MTEGTEKKLRIKCQTCNEIFDVKIQDVCHDCFFKSINIITMHNRKRSRQFNLRKLAVQISILFPWLLCVSHFFGLKVQLIASLSIVVGMVIDSFSSYMASNL